MEDVHMETPPASAVGLADSPLTLQQPPVEQQHASYGDIIRSNLGKSTAQDFGYYRDILEEHHDRRERIIKASRDINNFSKKMIFALHRAEPKDYLPQFSAASEALTEFKEKHATVLKLFHRVAIDLQGSNYYRYQRSVSGAIQEYIEAMTLEYYLVHGKLMPKSALEADLVFATTPEQLANPDLIIAIGQSQSGDSGSRGGGGQRGRFNKDNRKGPYNKDRRDGPKKPANPGSAGGPSSSTASAPIVEGSTSTTSESTSAAPNSPMVIETDQTASTTATASNESRPTPISSPPTVQLSLEVTDEDYLLGIADLTGELMRLAINTLGQSLMPIPQESDASGTPLLLSPEQRVQDILQFLRNIKSGFDGLSITKMSPISKKMGVLRQSLQKIELACYNVKVRGAEYPPEVLRQMLMSGPDLSNGGSGGGDSGAAGDEDED
ncbi:hypothetical protein BGX33_010191 [Mortierella sp. NVP41]|nr:hypothetical protein BGX33_010191 [Mortierella sp. NVP41]